MGVGSGEGVGQGGTGAVGEGPGNTVRAGMGAGRVRNTGDAGSVSMTGEAGRVRIGGGAGRPSLRAGASPRPALETHFELPQDSSPWREAISRGLVMTMVGRYQWYRSTKLEKISQLEGICVRCRGITHGREP